MKLIKLVNSENEQGQFYNFLNSELIIEKKSKIALNSIITQQEIQSLIITPTNNKVFVQLVNGIIKTIELKLGEYTLDNIDIFLNDFNYKLNGTLLAFGKAIGYEYKTSIDNINEKFSIQGKQSAFSYNAYNWVKSENIIFNSNRRVSKSSISELTEANAYYPVKNCQGCSIFQVRIYNILIDLIPENQQIFEVGLLNEIESSLDDETNQLLKIGFYSITGPYIVNYKGNEIITNAFPRFIGIGNINNDTIQFQKTENKLQIVIYNDQTPQGNIIFTTNILENDNLVNYSYIRLFQDGSKFELNGVQLTPSLFENSISSSVVADTDPLLSAPKQTTVSTKQLIEFDDYNLAILLGYNKKSSGIIFEKDFVFNAINTYNFNELVDAFQVELMNLKVDSYDCKTQGRNNILAVIPQSFNEKNQIVFEASTPIFLDLLNSTDIRLNEINIRLVKLDGSPLQIKGNSVIVLLIKNQNE